MAAIPLVERQFNKFSDQEVISKVLSGEKGLYEILLRRNNQKLYRIIRGYLNDHEEIEDVMQETYLTAYEKLYQFRQTSQFSTWLIRIGINKALQRIKKNRPTISLSDEDNVRDFEISQISPENTLIRKESKETLEAAIEKLEKKYRSVYIMKEIEQMSIAEISGCLGLSESNVKVRIHRAKSMIKENLYDLSLNSDLFEFGNKKCDLLVNRVMEQIL